MLIFVFLFNLYSLSPSSSISLLDTANIIIQNDPNFFYSSLFLTDPHQITDSIMLTFSQNESPHETTDKESVNFILDSLYNDKVFEQELNQALHSIDADVTLTPNKENFTAKTSFEKNLTPIPLSPAPSLSSSQPEEEGFFLSTSISSETSTQAPLLKEFQKDFKDKKNYCFDCTEEFSSNERYLAHLVCHHIEKAKKIIPHFYQCPFCSKPFYFKHHFEIHLRRVEKKSFKEIEESGINYWLINFKSEENNKKTSRRIKKFKKTNPHKVLNYHNLSDKVYCSICEIDFQRNDNLKNHFVCKHIEIACKLKLKFFRCPVCSPTYNTVKKSNFKRHLKINHKDLLLEINSENIPIEFFKKSHPMNKDTTPTLPFSFLDCPDPTCPFFSNEKSDLDNHITNFYPHNEEKMEFLTNDPMNLIEQKECNEDILTTIHPEYLLKTPLNNILNYHSLSQKTYCQICKEDKLTTSKLEEHLILNHIEVACKLKLKFYQCPICSPIVNKANLTTFVNHFKSNNEEHHIFFEENKERILNTDTFYKNHPITENTKKTLFFPLTDCPDPTCPFFSNSINDLKNHIKSFHSKEFNVDTLYPMKKNEENLISFDKKNPRKRESSHTNISPKKSKIEELEKDFKDKGKVLNSYNLVQNSYCQICEILFASKTDLYIHIVNNHIEIACKLKLKFYQCPHCRPPFNSFKKQHFIIHLNSKKHKENVSQMNLDENDISIYYGTHSLPENIIENQHWSFLDCPELSCTFFSNQQDDLDKHITHCHPPQETPLEKVDDNTPTPKFIILSPTITNFEEKLKNGWILLKINSLENLTPLLQKRYLTQSA